MRQQPSRSPIAVPARNTKVYDFDDPFRLGFFIDITPLLFENVFYIIFYFTSRSNNVNDHTSPFHFY